MKIYDQHLHSYLSYDCSQALEPYLQKAIEKGCTHFVSTEHCDLSCCYMKRDIMPDFQKQESILTQLGEVYGLNMLKGVEMGYKFSRIKDMDEIAKREDFDVVLMSVHENEIADCTSEKFLRKKTADDAYNAYLDLYVNMLTHCTNYDIVGHIDYLLRYIPKVDLNKHEKKLTELLNLVIEKEKTLEFNTRFLYQYKDSSYLSFIFSLYYSLGGRNVSLGSDCHTSDVFMARFDEATDILKNIGFTEICTFQKRKENRIAF